MRSLERARCGRRPISSACEMGLTGDKCEPTRMLAVGDRLLPISGFGVVVIGAILS
jgi:hypothetical protein